MFTDKDKEIYKDLLKNGNMARARHAGRTEDLRPPQSLSLRQRIDTEMRVYFLP